MTTTQGTNDSDNLTGTDSNDKIVAKAGDDVIDAGAGDDKINAGSGDDVVAAGSGDDKVNAGSGSDTVDAGSGDDRVNAGSGDDTVNGGSGNDVIHGGSGDDILVGGAGSDRIYGGSGNDIIYGDNQEGPEGEGGAAEVVTSTIGGDGANSWNGVTITAYDWHGNAADVRYTQNSTTNGIGVKCGRFPEVDYNPETGQSEALVIDFDRTVIDAEVTLQRFYSDEGAELNQDEGMRWEALDDAGEVVATGDLYASQGNWTVDPAGQVVLQINPGVNFEALRFTALSYSTDGGTTGDSSDFIIHQVSFNHLEAGAADILKGGSGNDTVYGGGGGDLIYGGSGDDVLHGESGNDQIRGGSGHDTITGGTGDDTIKAGSGNDTIQAGAGDDYVQGGKGTDTVTHSVADNMAATDKYDGGSSNNHLVMDVNWTSNFAAYQSAFEYAIAQYQAQTGGWFGRWRYFDLAESAREYFNNNGQAALAAEIADKTLNIRRFSTFEFIEQINKAPVAQPGEASVQEDGTAVAGQVVATDENDNLDPNGYLLGQNVAEGNLAFNSDGSYIFNPGSGFQDLDVGETRTVTFTYTASDTLGAVSAPATVTITVQGTEDAPVITGVVTGVTAEDGTQTATGTLTITDADASDNPISFADETVTSEYGEFALVSGAWTYTLDNSKAQFLDVNETATDSHEFTATDGSKQIITITILGAEDAPIIGGTFIGEVTEDGVQTATGTLTISDVDASDNPEFADTTVTSEYGEFVLASGEWTYTLDNNKVQFLDVNETATDSHEFITTDGSKQIVTVTINGAEDAAVITGSFGGDVAEDGTLTASGTVLIEDADASDNPISFPDVETTVAGDNGLGTFTLAGGTWTYTLDNSNLNVQGLSAGESVPDHHTFTATDGSTQEVYVMIAGADDGSVISGTYVGNVTEDGVQTAAGTLTITDIDTWDNPEFADVSSTLGDNAYGNFEMTAGVWTYTLNNGHSEVDGLGTGESLTDSYTFAATDGSTQIVTVAITGTNDAPVIGPIASPTYHEDSESAVIDSNIALSDVDSPNLVGATIRIVNYQAEEDELALPGSGVSVSEPVDDIGTIGPMPGGDIGVIIGDIEPDDGLGGAEEPGEGDEEEGSINASWNAGNGTLTLTGEATVAEYQAALRTITYENLSDDPNTTPRQIEWLVNDGETDSLPVTNAITVVAVNDAPVVSPVSASAAEDGAAVTGSFVVADPDSSDTHTFAIDDSGLAEGSVANNGDGTFTFNPGSDFQGLAAGETINVSFSYTANDGTVTSDPALVTITVTGTNDMPTVSAVSLSAQEDGGIAVGSFVVADVDISDSHTFTITNTTELTAGNVLNNHNGTFGFNPGSDFQDLGVGETRTVSFDYVASDGTATSAPSTVTITVAGTNDAPVVSDIIIATATEDDAGFSIDLLANASDVDINDVLHVENITLVSGHPAGITIDGNIIAVDPSAYNSLAVGENEVVEYSYNVADDKGGTTPQTVFISILGADDAPVIGGVFSEYIFEDQMPPFVQGDLTITDADASDNPISFPDAGAELGDNGFGEFYISGGVWSYVLNNAHPGVQALSEGAFEEDTHTFIASDGVTEAQVRIDIIGTDDEAVIGGTSMGIITEDGTQTVTGTLTISDVDMGDNPEVIGK